jgi:hypothetical protein
MVPLQNFATGAIAEIIRRQPASPGRTTFAWTVAAGPALARSATVALHGGVLTIRARDPRWAREIERAADTILKRMQHLLGVTSVSRIEVVN